MAGPFPLRIAAGLARWRVAHALASSARWARWAQATGGIVHLSHVMVSCVIDLTDAFTDVTPNERARSGSRVLAVVSGQPVSGQPEGRRLVSRWR